jgi:hypothetical protein
MKTKTKNERSKGCNFWDENNNPQKINKWGLKLLDENNNRKRKDLGFVIFG